MSDKTIYAVDDYPFAAFTTRKTIEKLSKHDCEVIDFESPVVLLSRFKKDYENVDLIVTDFEMPNLRGNELIGELRKIKPNIKIVVASAWLDTTSSGGKELIGKEVKSLNPDLVLAKPYPINWVNMIDELLD